MVRPSGDRGFALLIVAIALTALSLIFAAALETARQDLAATSVELTRVRLLAAVDGAIVTVEHDLAASRSLGSSSLYQPRTIHVGDVFVAIAVRPEAAKLDLNQADPDLLARYFSLEGLTGPTARDLAHRIAVRRKGPGPSLSTSRYDAGGNHLFQTVSELAGIEGASRDLVDCAAGDLTVFSNTSFVDWAHASARLKSAGDLRADAAAPSSTSFSVTNGRSYVAGEVFEVTARSRDDTTSTIVSKEVIIRVTGNALKPIWTLADTIPAPDSQSAVQACRRVAGGTRRAS